MINNEKVTVFATENSPCESMSYFFFVFFLCQHDMFWVRYVATCSPRRNIAWSVVDHVRGLSLCRVWRPVIEAVTILR